MSVEHAPEWVFDMLIGTGLVEHEFDFPRPLAQTIDRELQPLAEGLASSG